MTDILFIIVVTLPLVLLPALLGSTTAAKAGEEKVRKRLRHALSGLVSSGLPQSRIVQLTAHELHLITRGAK